jgi:O-antigen ligase
VNALQPVRHSLRGLEVITLLHVGIFVAGATWAFGGNASWVREPLTAWGGLAVLITLSALIAEGNVSEISLRPILWLWPLILYNVLAVASRFTPGMRELQLGPDTVMAPIAVSQGRPSAAVPAEVLPALWLFDALYLSCFNLVLTVRHRRAYRALLLFLVANAVALAVFGTVQKLTGQRGIFFGRIVPPQSYFFSTFVYDNHWGAFAILMAAVCLGLAVHYSRHGGGRPVIQTPAPGLGAALLLLVASVPLSGSRSCSALILVLLAGAFLSWGAAFIRRRRRRGMPVAGPLIGTVAAAALAAGAVWYVDQDVIAQRFQKTGEQFSEMRKVGGIGSRANLYRDTWRMARDRIWFGWGTASYPHVFMLYNTQAPDRRDRLPKFYHDAHSDWLQSLAEHGVVGTALLGLCGVVPLLGIRPRLLAVSVPSRLLAGCGLVLAYAWVEFPFGNVAVVLCWWLCLFCAAGLARLNAEEGSGGDRPAAEPLTP